MRLWTEGERAGALRAYDILDTGPEAAFEDMVEIARSLTGAPIAIVSLLDADRQWFKAVRGVEDLRETSLDTSFCMLAVNDDVDTLVIPDAAADPRTARMDVVTGPLAVRSYAGVLLRSPDGVPLGTVCVLDTEPRVFSDEAVASLRALARQTSALLELRRAVAERTAAASALRDVNLGRELAMQAARLGRWDHHPVEDRRFFDARALEILGMGEDGDISAAALLRRMDSDDHVQVGEALAAAMKADRIGPYEVEFRIGPEPRWVSCIGRTLFENGVCVRFFGVVEDITERKRSEEQRAFLTDELNHRVKNILALAQSVAESTLRAAPDVRVAREVLTGRLQALGRAHDVLLARQWRAASLRDVVVSTLEAAGLDCDRFELEGPTVQLGSRPALQLALAVHELATNARKYGALSNDVGRIALHWCVAGADGDGARLQLTWAERGGPPVVEPSRSGFGSRVTGRATEAAFDGRVQADYAPGGLRWSLDAPLAGLSAAGA